MRKKIIFTLLCIHSFLISGYSQVNDTSYTFKNSINVELGGKALLYSVEYIRCLNNEQNMFNLYFGSGLSFSHILDHEIIMPFMFYLSYGQNIQIESGIGVSTLFTLNPSKVSRDDFFSEHPEGTYPYTSNPGLNFNAQFGLRYENKRWIVRGYMLLINGYPYLKVRRDNYWAPWGGISFGIKL